MGKTDGEDACRPARICIELELKRAWEGELALGLFPSFISESERIWGRCTEHRIGAVLSENGCV